MSEETKIRALIIDDEVNCRKALHWDLSKSSLKIDIIGEASNGKEALDMIESLKPDLLFLDIEMPIMNGLQMVNELKEPIPKIIFTTAYDQFAIQALRMNAIDYLLKPIDINELHAAILNCLNAPTNNPLSYHHLQNALKEEELKIISFPVIDGYEFVEVQNIMYCTADSNYTVITIKDEGSIIVSKTLKEVESLLYSTNFVRIHKSSLINLSYLRKYKKGGGGFAIMKDGEEIPVSRRKKEVLINRFG